MSKPTKAVDPYRVIANQLRTVLHRAPPSTEIEIAIDEVEQAVAHLRETECAVNEAHGLEEG